MYLLGYPLSVLNRTGTVENAVVRTVRGTGGALLGSAATTAIGYAFIGAVFVLPSLLVLWARSRKSDRLSGVL